MTEWPQTVEVEVTAQDLADGDRRDYDKSPLAIAAKRALTQLELPAMVSQLTVTENSAYVWTGIHQRFIRYYVSDEAWKLVARHRAGLRVKPQTVRLLRPGTFKTDEPWRRDHDMEEGED